MNSLLLHEHTREEARALAAETLLVLPVGAIEQHGPHLPVGTDTFTVEALSRAAAAIAAEQIPVLVAPTLPFGSSHHHLPFGGTMSLRTETYYHVLCDLVESLITGGFRHIFIVNGHGGNHELVQLAARDLALKHPVNIAAGSYWQIAWEALVAQDAHVAGRLPGHAGAFETSMILALRSELVKEPRPHRDEVTGSDPHGSLPPHRVERHGSWQQIDGYSDSPDRGDGDRGRVYFDAITKAVAAAFVQFHTEK